MKRSVGITVAGVVSLLGSCAHLLIGLGMILVLILGSRGVTPAPGVVVLTSALFFVLCAAIGIATSLGLFRLRRWARISLLLFAGLLTLVGLCTPILLLTIQLPQVAGQDPMIPTFVKTAMAAFYLFLAAIGVWWLVFFNLPAIKAQFADGGATASTSARPLSITCVAGMLIFGALCLPFSLLMQFPAVMFGRLVMGWPATLWYIALAGVGLYVGVGLLRLDPRCRRLAIYSVAFGALNTVPFYLFPGSAERMAEMVQHLPAGFRPPANQPLPLPNHWVSVVFMLASVGLQLYFLVTRRAAFDQRLQQDAA
jgi:hypothetical protein